MNVAFGLEIQNIPLEKRNQKAQKVIEMVGLQGYESSYPKQLSGGMQQRVGIARAIATDSEILLMDEAFSALDPLIRTQMQDELIEIQQKLKKTIVFITHDLDEALKLGDTIAIMKDGVIVQQDNAENILLNPADDYVRSFIDDVDSAKVISAAGLMKPFKERIHIERDGPATAVRRMERFNHYFLPVVGQNNQFLGYIRIKDARRLVDARKKDVSSILIDVPTIQSDMLLVDTLPLFAEQNYPLAVVDVKNRPLGYLRYTSVVEMISGNGYDPDTKSISDNNSQTSTKQEQQTGESITTAEKE